MVRLLSVEDDPDLQRLLALALADEDFEVHFAFTGPTGFESAVALRPDIILCDLMLPGFGGQELIRRLKEQPGTCDIPVVVVTAYYDTATMIEAEVRKLGVIEYVRKPVRGAELLVLLRRIAANLPKAAAPRPEGRPAP
ncbi:MAG: response regulator [Elusimicrobia bacterium]|nr:response regulator [Elusimicrobiota bacterium]